MRWQMEIHYEWISCWELHSSLEPVVCERTIPKRYMYLKSCECSAGVQPWIRMYDNMLTGSIRFCQKCLEIFNTAESFLFVRLIPITAVTIRTVYAEKIFFKKPFSGFAVFYSDGSNTYIRTQSFYCWTQCNVKGLKRYHTNRWLEH